MIKALRHHRRELYDRLAELREHRLGLIKVLSTSRRVLDREPRGSQIHMAVGMVAQMYLQRLTVARDLAVTVKDEIRRTNIVIDGLQAEKFLLNIETLTDEVRA